MDQENFKLYRLNEQGRIVGTQPLDCRDEAKAMARARAIATHHVHELWNGARMVARVEPGGGAAG